MNAITITTPDQLVTMIIGVASFFLMGIGISYMVYKYQSKKA